VECDCDNRLAVPIYEYKCSNGHVFEAVQSMSEEPIRRCEICGAPVERVFHPVAVHFKGSGFYTTDYGSGAKASQDGAGKEGEKPKKPAEKSGKKDSAAKAGSNAD
jgi:putative FmdB family regulatory protein